MYTWSDTTPYKYWDRQAWTNSVDPARSDAAEVGIWSGSTLFATHPALFLDTSAGSKIDFFQILGQVW